MLTQCLKSVNMEEEEDLIRRSDKKDYELEHVQYINSLKRFFWFTIGIAIRRHGKRGCY